MISHPNLKDILYYSDGKLYWKCNIGRRIKAGNIAGSFHKSTGYYRIGIYGERYQLHRIIFYLLIGYLPKYVDHNDRDKTNNHIENLSDYTLSENRFNSSLNDSPNCGTWIDGRNGKYRARVRRNGKSKYLGSFNTQEEANIAHQNEIKRETS